MTRSVMLAAATLLTAFSSQNSQALPAQTVLYFDLGDVIIDSRTRGELKYFDGATDYLAEIKDAGYSINLATNFVDQLGDTTFHTCEDKFKGLASYIKQKWTGSEPFDWSPYDSVILPPKDSLRKPMPFMFVNILKSSCPSPAMYISENPKEIKTSSYLGLATWTVEHNASQMWIPVDEIEQVSQAQFKFNYQSNCQITFPNECRLDKSQITALLSELSTP